MPFSSRPPFTRVYVDHLFYGTTHVRWELDAAFNDARPYTYQLQAGYTGQNSGLDWVDIGAPAVDAFYLEDDTVRERTGKRLLTHYRIILTTARTRYVSAPQSLWGTLSTKDWNTAREIVRKEKLRLDAGVSRAGYLLRHIRHGKPDPKSTDFLTGAVDNPYAVSSWGTAYQAGYHPPVRYDIDMSNEVIAQIHGPDGPATYNTQPGEFNARVLAAPDIGVEDIWVDAQNDRRWRMHAVQITAAYRGVPLIYTVALRVIEHNHVVYRIPVSAQSYDPQVLFPEQQPTTGTGCVTVDHNYGGPQALSYINNCCGIEGANIWAFTTEDWDNDLRTVEYAVATSQTTQNGDWVWDMKLDPGDYVLRFEKPGEFGPDTITITVVADGAITSSAPSTPSSSPVTDNLFGPM